MEVVWPPVAKSEWPVPADPSVVALVNDGVPLAYSAQNANPPPPVGTTKADGVTDVPLGAVPDCVLLAAVVVVFKEYVAITLLSIGATV